MTTKSSHNKDGVKDVPADNPVGTMARFADGLKRVLTAKQRAKSARIKRRRP
jgi:hypothetical protein